MFRPRVIPVLLLKGAGLVKTRGFAKPRYVGDPINAVRIFSELEADELILLDIDATREGRTFPLHLVTDIGDEANMPFAVGGGIRDRDQARALLRAGAEKVVMSSAALADPGLIERCAAEFGSQAVVVVLDVKRRWAGGLSVFTDSGSRRFAAHLETAARMAEDHGAGEIVIQSIDRDGSMKGYDLDAIRRVVEATAVPVIALGGAGDESDLARAHHEAGATAAAAGSLFVFHGRRRAVLVNYPEREGLKSLFRPEH